ncbi:unnamed protein product [Auanema sp. JU1783]|nr:unnamed protein product [Auanema sp. JU1783]
MSSRYNWLNEGVPCAGDHIVFEEEKLTVAVLDRDIDVSQIEFSNTGVMYFDDNVILGRADYQQCQRKKSEEHAFYEPDTYFGSYYDPNSWKTSLDSPYLHMKWIPGPDDEVIFHDSNLQFYMEKPTRIAKLWYANRVRSFSHLQNENKKQNS